MQLSKDLREFIELLNANWVEFLVVGGFAVAWHGHPRFTADIEFPHTARLGKCRACGQDASGVRIRRIGDCLR